MVNNPKVSVIIPVYNRAALLSTAIDSAIAQTYTNVEIIVVNDGSTDNTEEIIAKYTGRIISVRQENKGQAAARNKGLELASGELIANLDSDDTWYPDFLKECITELVIGDYDFVFANWKQQTKEASFIDSFSRYFFLDPFQPNDQANGWIPINYKALRLLYCRYCPSPSTSFVIKKSSVLYGWNEKMNIGDDWCMLLDLILERPCKVAFTRKTLWQKGIDEINICDGRKVVELARLLYIADTKNIMDRFVHNLSAAEYKLFEIVYVENLIKLGAYHILREKDWSGGLRLWKQAVLNAPLMTLKGIGNLTVRKLQRNIRASEKKDLLQIMA